MLGLYIYPISPEYVFVNLKYFHNGPLFWSIKIFIFEYISSKFTNGKYLKKQEINYLNHTLPSRAEIELCLSGFIMYNLVLLWVIYSLSHWYRTKDETRVSLSQLQVCNNFHMFVSVQDCNNWKLSQSCAEPSMWELSQPFAGTTMC